LGFRFDGLTCNLQFLVSYGTTGNRSDTGIDIRKLTQLSFSALRAGDRLQAKSGFEQIIASGKFEAVHWLGLAFACSGLDDSTGAVAAVDKALELEPRNLRAILFKADYLGQLGDKGQSIEHYRYALRLAQNIEAAPDDIRQGLARAQQACAGHEQEYRAFLLDRLEARGLSAGQAHPRFQQSLDLIFGGKEVFYQQPRRYYYPGLPQIQFYQRDQFDWVGDIEAQTRQIRAELEAVLDDRSRFSPYVKSGNSVLGRDDQGLADNDDWSALYLWEYGRLVEENAAVFRSTIAALEAAPLPEITAQAPMALFSKLAANTRIPPHNGLLNTRLICHLPLIVPENCGALRVGNEERAWVEGEMLIFDDSIEHEAWNTSARQRVILLFEVWRPELATEERQMITTLLEAVGEYNAKHHQPTGER